MSRSYRKHPRGGCITHTWRKREAAKKVRKAEEIPPHMGYKKLFQSWNICDGKYLVPPFVICLRESEARRALPEKQAYRRWYTFYKRK